MKRSLIALAVSLAAFAGAIGVGGHGSAAQHLAVNDAVVAGEGMPRTLSEFGFFADATAQIPAAGVTPYRLNTPLFSDGADKLRFLYLPPGSQAVADGENLLQLPLGSSLI